MRKTLREKRNEVGQSLVTQMGQACATALRAAHPKHTAYYLNQITGADERTIDNWLAGQLPGPKHFALLAMAYKRPFVELVFEPVLGNERTEEDIIEEICTLTYLLKSRRRKSENGLDSNTEKMDGGKAAA